MLVQGDPEDQGSWRTTLLVGSLLAFVLLLGFGRLVAQPAGIIADDEYASLDWYVRPSQRAPGNDLTRLFLPRFRWTVGALERDGRVPSWDPRGFTGRPNVGNPQAGLWYPPVWLAWMTGHPAALGWLTVVHLLGAGIGTWVLLRSLRLPTVAAWLGAAAYELNPYLLAHVAEGHMPHVWAMSWTPWVIWALLAALRGKALACWAAPVFLSISLLSGHAQEGYYLVLAGVVTLIVHAMARLSVPGAVHSLARSGLLVGLAGLVVVGLTAVEWSTVRAAGAGALKTTRSTAGEAGLYHIEPFNLLQWISPAALGGLSDFVGGSNLWETQTGFGTTLAGMAVLALVRSPRRRLTLAISAAVVVLLAFAFGTSLGLFTLAYEFVPGMDRFRVPARVLFLVHLGSVALAALGLEVFATQRSNARRDLIGAASVVITLAVVVIVLSSWLDSRAASALPRHDSINSLAALSRADRLRLALQNLRGDSIGQLSMAFGLFLLFLRTIRPAWTPMLAICLAACASGELAMRCLSTLPISPASRWNLDAAAADVASLLPPSDRLLRVRAYDTECDDDLTSSGLIEKTNLNDLYQIGQVEPLYSSLYDLFEPRPNVKRPLERGQALELLAVDAIVTSGPPPIVSWPEVGVVDAPRGTWVVYRNPQAVSRAWIVPAAVVVSNNTTALQRLTAINVRDVVVLGRDPIAAEYPRQPSTPARVSRPSADELRVEVDIESAGYLVVSEAWMPGWKATLDGLPTHILRGNLGLRVIPLPVAGHHLIEMSYHAPGLRTGLWITLLSALAWGIGGGFLVAGRRSADT